MTTTTARTITTPNGRTITEHATLVDADYATGLRLYAFPMYEGDCLVTFVRHSGTDAADAFAALAESYGA